MLSDPLKFFDGLIRGIVLTSYDFVLLAVAGLLFPFVWRTRRFWPAVLSINKRLSSLTLLLVCLFLFFTLTANDLPELIAAVATNRDPGAKPIQIFVSALLTTMAVDLVSRGYGFLIVNSIRRTLYVELLRTSFASLFFAASIVMLVGTNTWLFGRIENLLGGQLFGIPFATVKLYVPGLSVCFVAARGLSMKSMVKRIPSVALAAFFVPGLLLALPLFGGLAVSSAFQPLREARQPITIVQSDTRCEFVGNPDGQPRSQIKLTTFLKIDGETSKSAVLPTKRLIAKRANGGRYVRVSDFGDMRSEVVLSNSSFNRYELLGKFSNSDNEDVAQQMGFECLLFFSGGGLFGSDLPIDDRSVGSWH